MAEDGPPDGCLCTWAHYDDDRGWVHRPVEGCPIHPPDSVAKYWEKQAREWLAILTGK